MIGKIITILSVVLPLFFIALVQNKIEDSEKEKILKSIKNQKK